MSDMNYEENYCPIAANDARAFKLSISLTILAVAITILLTAFRVI